jgi:ABC-type antimicrobial peptide transport system permease subunit
MLSDTIATPRLRMFLASAFAALALLLALTGMYGVMSYVAAQRAPEFGVRVALGASPRHVILLVLRQAALLAAIGVAIGFTLAAASGKVISSMLFGLKASDATTYALVLLALTVFAVLAAAVPASRASRIDPMVALRYE